MPILKKGTIKRIHVNGALLRSGTKAKKPIALRHKGKVKRASEVVVYGPSRMVYRPTAPLRGTTARVWVETEEEVWYS